MKNLLTTICLLGLFIGGLHFFSNVRASNIKTSMIETNTNMIEANTKNSILETNTKTRTSETKTTQKSLNNEFLNSLQGNGIKEPLFIGMKKHFNVEELYVNENLSVEYINYNGDKIYKMNVRRISYEFYVDGYFDGEYYIDGYIDGTYGDIIGNIWCNLDTICYRTGVMANRYGDLVLNELIPFKDRHKYTTKN